VNSIVGVWKQKSVNMQDGRADDLKEERAMLKGLWRTRSDIENWLKTPGKPAFDRTLGETRSDRVSVRVPVDKFGFFGSDDVQDKAAERARFPFAEFLQRAQQHFLADLRPICQFRIIVKNL
jgi:hypothetical protein